MTDNELLFDFLQSHIGEWWNVIDISRILKPGCVNWAVRSRRCNLNKRFFEKKEPYYIERRTGENGCADYRLVKDTPPQPNPVMVVFEGEQAVMGL